MPGAGAAPRRGAVPRLGFAKRGDGFKRELGVDHQRAPVVAGQIHDAIRPLTVGERVLERIGVFGQPVGHDRFHTALAEGAARLLVGEHVLERDHMRGKFGDARLGGVDDSQPFIELA